MLIGVVQGVDFPSLLALSFVSIGSVFAASDLEVAPSRGGCWIDC